MEDIKQLVYLDSYEAIPIHFVNRKDIKYKQKINSVLSVSSQILGKRKRRFIEPYGYGFIDSS